MKIFMFGVPDTAVDSGSLRDSCDLKCHSFGTPCVSYRGTLRDQTYPSARWDHPPESSADSPPSWDRRREPWRGGRPPNPRRRLRCHSRCCGTSGAPWIEVGVGSLEPLETRSAVTDRARVRCREAGGRGGRGWGWARDNTGVVSGWTRAIRSACDSGGLGWMSEGEWACPPPPPVGTSWIGRTGYSRELFRNINGALLMRGHSYVAVN